MKNPDFSPILMILEPGCKNDAPKLLSFKGPAANGISAVLREMTALAGLQIGALRKSSAIGYTLTGPRVSDGHGSYGLRRRNFEP